MSIRTELLALRNEDGLIVPGEAVVWARDNPGSDLHNALEWDDEAAGEQWRHWQVRRLVALHIISEEGDRQVVSLSTDRRREGGGYRHTDEVLAAPDLREIMLSDALEELQRVENKYRRLQELAAIWDAAHTVRRTRTTRRRSLPSPAAEAAAS